MANILVVEDDDLFRKAICDLLKKKVLNYDEPGMSGLLAIRQIEVRSAGRYDEKVMEALKVLFPVSKK